MVRCTTLVDSHIPMKRIQPSGTMMLPSGMYGIGDPALHVGETGGGGYWTTSSRRIPSLNMSRSRVTGSNSIVSLAPLSSSAAGVHRLTPESIADKAEGPPDIRTGCGKYQSLQPAGMFR